MTNVTNTKFELAYTRGVARLLKYFKGGNDKVGEAGGEGRGGQQSGPMSLLCLQRAAAVLASPNNQPIARCFATSLAAPPAPQGDSFDVTTPTLAGDPSAC